MQGLRLISSECVGVCRGEADPDPAVLSDADLKCEKVLIRI